jgi:hypothetical protein
MAEAVQRTAAIRAGMIARMSMAIRHGRVSHRQHGAPRLFRRTGNDSLTVGTRMMCGPFWRPAWRTTSLLVNPSGQLAQRVLAHTLPADLTPGPKREDSMRRLTKWLAGAVASGAMGAGCGADSTDEFGNAVQAASRAALDQFTNWSEPVNLGPGVEASLGPPINTPNVEAGSFITRDGLSFYFTSNRPGGCGETDIWVSTRPTVGAAWGPAQHLDCTINSSALDAAPIITTDGHRMYFHSRRANVVGESNPDLDIYVSRRRDLRDPLGWEPPERLSINTDLSEGQPAFFEDDQSGIGTLFFTSNRPGGLGHVDIWSSALQPGGTFADPDLVEELSSPFRDQAPFIRRDGLEMFLSSERDNCISLEQCPTNSSDMSRLDLFVATRASTSDPWSTPVNLDKLDPTIAINSPLLDDRPTLSFDGTRLYFQSPRVGGEGLGDLYVMTRSKLRDPD